ncbi:glutamine amidotransferase-related protein [Corynebacterium aquatimens]|uniref:anthranilate synthase n=1 Tax=Corynebacterium aquatimens TaxID=1190508 RepID=A0A931E1X4_9CORY|nr:gamma-glutamyl-gamma-aminobutyrate hydrolase family protein [Corynebacterium aquatimens]MBG6122738.1 anthranilate synthase component 2 [Corynebacterium aquatimens]WJY66925.1 Anthranilate synthase component 2 [Corynebacterium aquatimens]
MSRIVLLDNQDSFVYNLVDALSTLADHEFTVYRNTVPAQTIIDSAPDLVILSPGPGYPADAGCMMELIAAAQGRIPLLGICLGFQALVEHFGGAVTPCGPVHGESIGMTLTDEGLASPIFEGLAIDGGPEFDSPGVTVPVARYHSLGTVDVPEELVPLARTKAATGNVVMAAQSRDGMSIGLQYHPESILTPAGPIMLERCVYALIQNNTQKNNTQRSPRG